MKIIAKMIPTITKSGKKSGPGLDIVVKTRNPNIEIRKKSI